MVISADTSFLFSLYGNDVRTGQAVAWVKSEHHPLTLTVLNEYELGNALRFAEFCNRLSPGQSALFWAEFEADRAAGRVKIQVTNLAEVLAEAKRLSAARTLTGGHRGFDILHVASALKLKATHFLTFDANQKRLAEAEGLVVPL
jgi:predicted nucleic acid-binding protein